MPCRGLRGATTAAANTAEAIQSATRELLECLVEANRLDPDEIASVIFTMSPDLNAAYPATTARELGWYEVALLCAQEIDVPEGVKRCIRVLIHWNTEKPPHELVHVYLNGAVGLRPDRIRAALTDEPT
ncbi:MAG TPA: chorismate mutase [Anaerolineae bacterium]|nr:chorismate mutase [Anaerolineae bacterium]